jgi:hypothetical protein
MAAIRRRGSIAFPSTRDAPITRTAYDQLCLSYRAIDDFRAKLLGFLPLVTGGGLVLTTSQANIADEFYTPIGVFGLAVTLGLFFYEIFGIKKCHALISAGRALETSLELKEGQGQFTSRPPDVLRLINEPFAAAIIYPAVMAAWTYIAVCKTALQTAQGLAPLLATTAFALGFLLTIAYDHKLKQDRRLKALAIIYPAVVSAWTYIAFRTFSKALTAAIFAAVILVLGLLITTAYDSGLKKKYKDAEQAEDGG